MFAVQRKIGEPLFCVLDHQESLFSEPFDGDGNYANLLEEGLPFFAELLDLGLEEAETQVAEMVTQGLVWAKIDQMEGTVTFTKRKEVNETLNDWSGNIGKLVDKLEKVTFLVNKEFQNYKIPTEA